MHHKTYDKHQGKLKQVCQDETDSNLLRAADIRSLYKDVDDEEEVMDITVSFDGTWQKRGFSSH